MSSKDNETSRGESGSGTPNIPKRPARTIDLEAEEVEVDKQAAAPDAESDAETTASNDDASGSEPDAGANTESDGVEAGGLSGNGKAPPPPRTPPSELKRFVTHLAAGLVGGLVGVVAAGVGLDRLPLSGLMGNSGAPDKAAQVEQRLDELASALQEQQKTITSLPAGTVIKTLEERLNAIETKPAPEPALPEGIDQRLARLEETLKTLESAGAGPDATGIEQAAALTARLDAIEQALESKAKALGDEIADAKAAAAAAATAAAKSAGSEIIDDAALGKLDARLTALEQKLANLAARPETAVSTTGGTEAAIVLAFESLRRAANHGDPFQTQLEVLDRLAGTNVDLKALSASAKNGVPTPTVLLRELPSRLADARNALSRPDNETFLDRLASNASSIIRVRKVGPVDGSDASAVLSRLEAAAKAADLNAAITQARQLEGPPAEAIRPWLEKAEARRTLDAALKAIEAGVLARVGNGVEQR